MMDGTGNTEGAGVMALGSKRKSLVVRVFTLVELLVVVAVIAILSSLLLPALSRAKKAATDLACINNLKQCGALLFSYADDFNRYFPPANGWDFTQDPYTNATFTHGFNQYRMNPGTPKKYDSFALGLLWKLDYCNNPSLMFCEEIKSGYVHPTVGAQYWTYYHTYVYAGGMKQSGWGGANGEPCEKIGDYPGAVLAYDCFLFVAHRGMPSVLYADGAAMRVKTKSLAFGRKDLQR